MRYPAQSQRVLDLIGQLYAVESRAKAMKVSSSEKLLAWRPRFSCRPLERLRLYMDGLSVQVLPKSPLDKAISYTLNNWKALNRYTEAAQLQHSKWYPQVIGADAAAHETDKLAARTARLFVAGQSNWEITFRTAREREP